MHSKNLRNSVERSPVLHILSCIVWRLAYPANNKPKSSHRNKKKHNDPISDITCLASPSTSALHHTTALPHTPRHFTDFFASPPPRLPFSHLHILKRQHHDTSGTKPAPSFPLSLLLSAGFFISLFFCGDRICGRE